MIFTTRARIPTLNEWIRHERGNKFAAATVKANTQKGIYFDLLASCGTGYPRFGDELCDLSVVFVLGDRRKDFDNVQFGLKFVQDALVFAEVIGNDDERHLNPPRVYFAWDKADPRTVVEVKKAAKPYEAPGDALRILAEAARR